MHAAGLYDSADQPKIFQFVISSYTPSITALLNASRRSVRNEGNGNKTRLLAVSLPSTTGEADLPGTVDEARGVESCIGASVGFTWLNDTSATSADVLRLMEDHSWLHLACHGVQDPHHPSDSAFLLHDGPLTLADITARSVEQGELAFLSACQTAKGSAQLPEEAAHSAAGMLTAGYQHVIATMWSIADVDRPVVAREFYGHCSAKEAARASTLRLLFTMQLLTYAKKLAKRVSRDGCRISTLACKSER